MKPPRRGLRPLRTLRQPSPANSPTKNESEEESGSSQTAGTQRPFSRAGDTASEPRRELVVGHGQRAARGGCLGNVRAALSRVAVAAVEAAVEVAAVDGEAAPAPLAADALKLRGVRATPTATHRRRG